VKFGLFGGATAGRNTSTDDSDSFRNFVDFVVEADAVGLAGLFVVEHHFTGFGQVSATMNLLTYLAAKTKDIRLGPGVMVLPWHNPVLLAEQAATLDVLSEGRLDMGVGKGYRYNEFQHFCVPLGEAEERFEESIGLMKRAWTSEERFSYHSARWNFEEIVVEPAPVQKPHPPLWLAAGRPESIRAAARGGYNLLLDQFATFDVIAQRLAIYRDEIVKMGKTFDPMTVGVSRAILLVRNAEERAKAVENRSRSLARMNAFGRSPDGKYVSSMTSDSDLVRATEEGALIGEPDEVIERIHGLKNAGVGYILLVGMGTRIPTLHAFAKEVMPAVA
jgi:alkanesulfonate monooxygenase SsuD/methylene tetrahydromethanopterin reductase-like flavin-dependent oxidoreductase (luciferase family)